MMRVATRVLLALLCGTAAAATTPVENLRVEYFASPLAVDTASPRFSWELPSDGSLARGVGQKSYSIMVYRGIGSDGPPLWVSGAIESKQTHGIRCNATLRANALYEVVVHWTPTAGTRDERGAKTIFGVGPLAEQDWGEADWIGGETQRQIRGSFDLNASTGVAYALLHVAAPGCAVVSVNSQRVAAQHGDGNADLGICPWSLYTETILYQTYNISGHLVDGENVVGLLLGQGTYFAKFHAESTVRVLLNIGVHPPMHTPGALPRRHTVVSTGGPPLPGPPPPPPPRRHTVVSTTGQPAGPPPGLLPSVWKATASYSKRDDIWRGTELDWSAHAASLGWDSPGSTVVASWSTAAKTWPPLVAALPLPRANMLPPTAVIRTLKPTKVDTLGNSTFVYTFPENFVGVLSVEASHIRLRHGGAGGSVSFQHSEVLANGTGGKRGIDRRFAFHGQTVTHSFGADWSPPSPTATLTPLFVWHGGQFVQVTVQGDLNFDASMTSVTALVTHANLTQTGHIHFSGGDERASATLNGLNRIILNSQTSNVAAGMPTDCPTCADLLVGPMGETMNALLENCQLVPKSLPGTLALVWVLWQARKSWMACRRPVDGRGGDLQLRYGVCV
eukprot:SAG11_NODE_210_length_12303_cov_10.235824_3_plen_619_part_00